MLSCMHVWCGYISSFLFTLLCILPNTRLHYHYIVDEDGLTFMVVATEDVALRVAFSYLNDIRSQFQEQCGTQWRTAIGDCALNDVFARSIARSLEYWNNPDSEKLTKARNQIDSVKGEMISTIGVCVCVCVCVCVHVWVCVCMYVCISLRRVCNTFVDFSRCSHMISHSFSSIFLSSRALLVLFVGPSSVLLSCRTLFFMIRLL
jgi:Regulated-SNARE-like domain